MKKEMDKIQFEYRYELEALMKVIDRYIEQNPSEKNNKTLERFFDLLDGMKEMDKIQFEYRYELEALMKVIDRYIEQNPSEKNNKTLERFFDLLDGMHMDW